MSGRCAWITSEVVIFSVLVVEGEPAVVYMVVGSVERVPGFGVAGHARTGTQALRRLAMDPVDLVVLDTYLPDISGLEVLRRMRAGGSTVDVIAVTAAREVSVLRSALALGVVQYLLKPLTFTTVRIKLECYSTYRAALSEYDPVMAQQEIDHILKIRSEGNGVPRTGANRVSLHLVAAALKQLAPNKGLSAAQVAGVLGASRITARRYLEHLVHSGLLMRLPRYRTRGRPEVEYRLVSAPIELSSAGGDDQ